MNKNPAKFSIKLATVLAISALALTGCSAQNDTQLESTSVLNNVEFTDVATPAVSTSSAQMVVEPVAAKSVAKVVAKKANTAKKVAKAKAKKKTASKKATKKSTAKKTTVKKSTKKVTKKATPKKSVAQKVAPKKAVQKPKYPIAATINVPYAAAKGGTLRQLQAKVDTCRTVDATAYYGMPMLNQHYHCGGKVMPTVKGKYIKITGYKAGIYKTLGVVKWLNVYTDSVADVPRGYDLLYQTCLKGSTKMGVIGLQKVG